LKYALLNPDWSFDGSIYFGCKEAHFPLELAYPKANLENAGQEALLIDAHLEGLRPEEIRSRIKAFAPDFTIIPTAPSYLFWRCPPPELRVPQETASLIRDIAGEIIAIGPHASTTPASTIRKLGAAAALIGEPDECLPLLANNWDTLPFLYVPSSYKSSYIPAVANLQDLPSLRWDLKFIIEHSHHHHRFDDGARRGPGAEVEASRGCPYKCFFCAKENFRNSYRKRPLETVLSEIEGLLSQGTEYIYFIDELFTPYKELLEELALRPLKFGIQTRIDLWNEETLDLLGKAGCVSIEAGVESISLEGRELFGKKCGLDNDEITALLIYARKRVPFVQANLLYARVDSPEDIASWREGLLAQGVWANKPVPLFPYPGSPEYERRWGRPDDLAWERAHAFYLDTYREFSDIQEETPAGLKELEF
jgi:anaerobic magnesium-protoporphyrin IX monomethyl ester cyclase